MSDYYELLGIARDASTDEIKSAYRERIDQARGGSGAKGVAVASAAELNQAWNVLADPFQRRRYDEQLRSTESTGDTDEGAVPAARPTMRRRPPRSAVPQTSAPADTDGDEPASGAPVRRPPAAPVELPNGLMAPPTRNRVNAILVDVLVIYLAVLVLLPLAFAPFRHDALVVYKNGTQVGSPHSLQRDVAAQRAKLLADERAVVAKATKPGQKPAKVEVKKQKVFSSGIGLVLSLASLLVALAVVVPASAITGQTLGKKIFRVRLVRVDGSPAGWAASTLHYGLPIVLGLLLQTVGLLVGVLLVAWFIRDPLRQGVHDKLAKTFVVMVPT